MAVGVQLKVKLNISKFPILSTKTKFSFPFPEFAIEWSKAVFSNLFQVVEPRES